MKKSYTVSKTKIGKEILEHGKLSIIYPYSMLIIMMPGPGFLH